MGKRQPLTPAASVQGGPSSSSGRADPGPRPLRWRGHLVRYLPGLPSLWLGLGFLSFLSLATLLSSFLLCAIVELALDDQSEAYVFAEDLFRAVFLPSVLVTVVSLLGAVVIQVRLPEFKAALHSLPSGPTSNLEVRLRPASSEASVTESLPLSTICVLAASFAMGALGLLGIMSNPGVLIDGLVFLPDYAVYSLLGATMLVVPAFVGRLHTKGQQSMLIAIATGLLYLSSMWAMLRFFGVPPGYAASAIVPFSGKPMLKELVLFSTVVVAMFVWLVVMHGAWLGTRAVRNRGESLAIGGLSIALNLTVLGILMLLAGVFNWAVVPR